MKAIGIDIGTTSVCGVLIDIEKGTSVKSITKNSDAFIDSTASWEKIQSVEKIISVAQGIIDELLDSDTVVIGVTGQMHGIVYEDADGNAVSPLYTWQDGRGNLPYKGTTYAKYLNSFSGYGNVTDFYNSENCLIPENAVSYSTIHDYFVMKLCSLKEPIMHSSDAASFGCYNLTTNTFDYPCKSKVVANFEIAGTYKGIPVSVAIGDNQASVFSTLQDEDNILINVGTGSQVSIVSDCIVSGENIEARPYFNGKYLIVGAALCGGRAYSLLRNFYKEILKFAKDFNDAEIYNIMDSMLENKDQLTLSADTRFAGTRRNTDICGSISGITTENFTPCQLTKSVVGGMVDELYNMYLEMDVKRSGIVASGNGIRKNPALKKAFEGKFGAAIKVPNHLEEAAFGAALFGIVSAKLLPDAKTAQKLIKYN